MGEVLVAFSMLQLTQFTYHLLLESFSSIEPSRQVKNTRKDREREKSKVYKHFSLGKKVAASGEIEKRCVEGCVGVERLLLK